MTENTQGNPEYKFEPGSCENERGHFPSIACLELNREEQWKYLFMIEKKATYYSEPDAAARIAVEDLQQAMNYDQSSESDSGMAEYLKNIGYQNYENSPVEGIG